MFKGKLLYIVPAILVASILFVSLAWMASSAGHVTAIATFNPTYGEFPEGIAVDKKGNIFVGLGPPLGPFGEIRKIAPDGTASTYLHLAGGPGPSGLAGDAKGTLYYGLWTLDEATRGVYRMQSAGVSERIPGSGGIILPNGLAFDDRGNLYVSDSTGGAVWRIPRNGTAELWRQHESLEPCFFDPSLPPVGANGIAYRHNNLYVASTEQGLIVRIPVLPDGSPGEPEIIAGSPECNPVDEGLDSVDGIAMDVHGDLYALLVIQNKLVKIDTATGEYVELLDETDGLHNPASVAFGTGRGLRQQVFFTNFALIPPGPEASMGPAILAYDIGVPGLPLP